MNIKKEEYYIVKGNNQIYLGACLDEIFCDYHGKDSILSGGLTSVSSSDLKEALENTQISNLEFQDWMFNFLDNLQDEIDELIEFLNQVPNDTEIKFYTNR